MTNLELIEETIQYYSEDTTRRGIDDYKQMCVYKSDDNKYCAIGRMIDEELLKKDEINWCHLNGGGNVEDVIIENINVFKYFKPQYKSITSLKFLKDLQRLHDNNDNWDEYGLTVEGKHFAEQLKITYA